MIKLRLSEIIVPPDRQRFTALDKTRVTELTESFKSIGQMHPITVRRESNQWLLVAGFRRLTARLACADSVIRCGHGNSLEAQEIAAIDWGELDLLTRGRMELEENVLRVDLSFQERAKAVAALYNVKVAEAKRDGLAYTAADLAADSRLGSGKDKIAEAASMLQVARHLHDPEVASAPDLKSAVKIIDRKMRGEELASLRERHLAEAETAGCPHALVQGDWRDPNVMAQLPKESFDVLCIDPPYGEDANKFGSQGTKPGTGGHQYDDDAGYFDELLSRVPVVAGILLKSEAHVYVFCASVSDWERWKLTFELEGFEVWPRPLIWVKTRGIAPRPLHGPRNSYEVILFASRGGKQTEQLMNDVIQVGNVHEPVHAAQKPVELYVNLLSRSVRPGNMVLDLFAGSGTIFPAASQVHAVAWGVERSHQYYDIALSRMTEKPAAAPLDGQSVLDGL